MMESTPDLEIVHKYFREMTTFLVEKKITITTMESCTSGFIASLITDTEGSSAVIKGACVTYSNEAKIKMDVNEKIIADFGVYSTETAEAMVNAVLKIYPSDIGIGVTGTFGNVDPNNKDSIPGKVYLAVRIFDKLYLHKLTLPLNISRFESKLCVAEAVYDIINAGLISKQSI